MIYKVPRIMRDVRIAMDRNMVSESLIEVGDVDTLSLDEIIRSKIEEGVQRVENIAPVQYLEEGHEFGDAIYWMKEGSGRVLLPDDFMRMIAFRMSDWEQTVYSPISASSPIYPLQHSRYKGIRGNPQKPVCAIVNRPEGKTLEFYSSKSEEAYVQIATYIPYPKIDEDDGIDISERCYPAVVYAIAALVLTAYGTADKSAEMNAMAQTYFEHR